MSRNQVDKILDNKFESVENDNIGQINFIINSDYLSSLTEEDKMFYMILIDKIDEIILASEFICYNKVNENGEYKKLNKIDINKVYIYVVNNLNSYSKLDLFGAISDYFDISYYKLYDSLSNKLKEDLIFELKELGKFKDKSKESLL